MEVKRRERGRGRASGVKGEGGESSACLGAPLGLGIGKLCLKATLPERRCALEQEPCQLHCVLARAPPHLWIQRRASESVVGEDVPQLLCLIGRIQVGCSCHPELWWVCKVGVRGRGESQAADFFLSFVLACLYQEKNLQFASVLSCEGLHYLSL